MYSYFIFTRTSFPKDSFSSSVLRRSKVTFQCTYAVVRIALSHSPPHATLVLLTGTQTPLEISPPLCWQESPPLSTKITIYWNFSRYHLNLKTGQGPRRARWMGPIPSPSHFFFLWHNYIKSQTFPVSFRSIQKIHIFGSTVDSDKIIVSVYLAGLCKQRRKNTTRTIKRIVSDSYENFKNTQIKFTHLSVLQSFR